MSYILNNKISWDFILCCQCVYNNSIKADSLQLKYSHRDDGDLDMQQVVRQETVNDEPRTNNQCES